MPNPKHHVTSLSEIEFQQHEPGIYGYGTVTFANGTRGEVTIEILDPEDGFVHDDVVYFQAEVKYRPFDDEVQNQARVGEATAR